MVNARLHNGILMLAFASVLSLGSCSSIESECNDMQISFWQRNISLRQVQNRAQLQQEQIGSKSGIEVEPHALREGRGSSVTYPFGHFWKDVPDRRVKDAYMAYVGERPTSVEYIALFSSGQQGGQVLKLDHANIISGTNGYYRWKKKDVLDGKSLSGQFFKCEGNFCFDQKKTLQVSIFDNEFSFHAPKKEKLQMLKGYEDFLLDHVKGHEQRLKAVYLAGGSRGGCLVARLAKSMMARPELSHTKFIVQSFDGVCNHHEAEFGTTKRKYYNPKRSRRKWWKPTWFAYRTDIKKQFNSAQKQRLCMRQITAGEAIGWARPFTDCKKKKCAFKTGDGSLTYYEEEWVTKGHGTILGHHDFKKASHGFPKGLKEEIDHSYSSHTVVPMIQHFKNCMQMLDIV